jgi:hypothetical protein
MRRSVVAASLAFSITFFTPRWSRAQNEPPFRAGFGPKTIAGSGTATGQIAVGDLFKDGQKEIVFTTANRLLYVIRPDGTIPSGWPQAIPAQSGSGPAIGYVEHQPGDATAFPDIVVSYGTASEADTTHPGGIRAFRKDGSIIWTRTTLDIFPPAGPDGVESTPAIGDIDGDGWNEVVVGAFDERLYVLDGRTGGDRPGFPFNNHDTFWSSPALVDLLGDGKKEIIVGGDRSNNGFLVCGVSSNGGVVHVFLPTGQELTGWPRCVDQVVYSSPAVGDIDGDGVPEIIVGGGTFFSGAGVGHKVYAFHIDGSTVAGWPVATSGNSLWPNSAALADLDGDSVLDVILCDDAQFLYAWKGNGTLLWQIHPLTYFGSGANFAPGNPIVADVNNDGFPEVLVPLNTEIAVISHTGAQLTDAGQHLPGQQSYFMETSTASAAVTDLDNDGVLDVIGTAGHPFPSPTDATVYVWNPASSNTFPEGCRWPLFHQDPSRSGSALGPGTCYFPLSPALAKKYHTIVPCRTVDTRNPPGPSGGPRLSRGESRTFGFSGGCAAEIPANAVAIALNVTVINPGSSGDLRIYPAGSPVPPASAINFSAGRTRANNAIIPVSGNPAHFTVQCDMGSGTSNLAIDISGYFD